MKGKVYRCCLRSAIQYRRKTLGLKEHEMAILRRTKRAMMRGVCGRKFADRKTTGQIDMLGLKETADEWIKPMESDVRNIC